MMKGKEKDSSFTAEELWGLMGFLDPSLSVHLNEASVLQSAWTLAMGFSSVLPTTCFWNWVKGGADKGRSQPAAQSGN